MSSALDPVYFRYWYCYVSVIITGSMENATFQVPSLKFLSGGGEMGRLIRAYDWGSTPLGPPEYWPHSLKTSIAIMLRSGYPIFVWWGPEMIMFHNDAYLPVLGKKHPYALGKEAKTIWSEIWDQVGPMMDQVLNKGEQIHALELLFLLGRKGFSEECYFTFSYSPIPNDDGNGVGGIFCASNEETQKVLRQRRLKTLKDISSLTLELRKEKEVYETSLDLIGQNPNDIPFSLLYYLEEDAGVAYLAGYTGFENDHHPAIVPVISLTGNKKESVFSGTLRTGEAGLMKNLGENGDVFPGGVWKEPSENAYVVPLKKSGHDQPVGFLICGLSTKLEFDEEYKSYLTLVGGQISTALANVRAFEEERKRAEALAQIDRAKTTFFSNVSHEFRTPLTLILGPIEEALADDNHLLPGEKQRYRLIRRNARRLQKLVNNLLDFSRIESGRIEAVYTPTDLPGFTADLASSFRSVIESAGLFYLVEIEPIPEKVFVDREMWEKIVLNLLSNAFKFTMEGSIRVGMKEENGQVAFSVTDTGTGIPEKELPKIFDRFHRVENAIGRTHEGSGIGLALIQELIKLHGGSIRAESKPGIGSKFTVHIPLGKKHLPAEKIDANSKHFNPEAITQDYLEEIVHLSSGIAGGTLVNDDAGNKDADKKPYILIADDNADMQGYLRHMLNSCYEVKTVKDGMEALKCIAEKIPDLLITDIMMPNLNGFGLLKEVRKDAATKLLPVIMLSARAGEEARLEGINAGADEYLVKPFSSTELQAVISNQLRQVKLRIETNRKLREERQKFYNLFLHAPVAITILRGPEFIIELANEKALELWDKTIEEVLEKKALREVFPELIDQGFEQILNGVYNGERYIHNDVPFKLMRNGKLEKVFINFVYEPLRDIEGSIYGIMGLGVEVTDMVVAREAAKKNAEELEMKVAERTIELKEQKDFVETVIDSSVDYICAINHRKELLLFNSTYEKLTGKKREEVLGLPITDIFPRLKISNSLMNFEKALHGEVIYDPVYYSEITGCYYENFFIPLRNSDGQVYGALLNGHDITDRIESEEKLKKNNQQLTRINMELEQFAYIASHDLQEPLRKIQTFSNLLFERRADNELSKKYYDKVVFAATRMSTLIRDVLNYSRLSDKEVITDIDLNQVLFNVKSDFELVIKEKKAWILSDQLPVIKGHDSQLNQLFSNLLSNALKFADKDPLITITTGNNPDRTTKKELLLNPDKTYYHIIFKDNGIGFDNQYAEKIFVIFQRLNNSHFEGTGIGLAICKKIMDYHEGTIMAESNPGKGTSFHIYFPDPGDD